MGKVAIWNNWENQRKVWCHSNNLFSSLKYLNPILKSPNFRIRIMKYRDKESLMP